MNIRQARKIINLTDTDNPPVRHKKSTINTAESVCSKLYNHFFSRYHAMWNGWECQVHTPTLLG